MKYPRGIPLLIPIKRWYCPPVDTLSPRRATPIASIYTMQALHSVDRNRISDMCIMAETITSLYYIIIMLGVAVPAERPR